MIKFKTFLNEERLFENFYLDLLTEESTTKSSGTGQAADTKGKLHEILVGYHLMGGKHMDKHVDEDGDSPEQAHDKLKEKVTPEEYDKIHKRAKVAADDIKSKIPGKIEHVHWTSKAGDIKRTTGIDSSQKEDQSDLIVNTTHKGKVIHHGVSLKVTDTTSPHVPVANVGKDALHPEFDDERKAHIKKMEQTFPELKGVSNAAKRKEIQKADPQKEEKMRAMNLSFLQSAAANTHRHLLSMGQHELIDHIKTNVLQSNHTPMQKQGHNHIRHTTYVAGKKEGSGFKTHSLTPSEHYSKYFDGSHEISAQNSGTQIHFHATNKTTGEKTKIASQRLKLNSGSDPFSSVKSSGLPAV